MMHVERHFADLDVLIEVLGQFHCRIPERHLSLILIDPEVHCRGKELSAHADPFLAPVTESDPSCSDVFHLVSDFFGVWTGNRHANRFHELAQAFSHVNFFRLVADRGCHDVTQQDPGLRARRDLAFFSDIGRAVA